MIVELAVLWMSAMVAQTAVDPVPAESTESKPKKVSAGAAFVLIAANEVDSGIAAEIARFFVEANSYFPEYHILSGAQLPKKLTENIARCGPDVLCMARQGRRVRVREIILAQLTPSDTGGVRFRLLAVNVMSREIQREQRLDFRSAEEVKPVLAGAYFKMVGISTPGYVDITEAPDQVRVDGTPRSTREGPVKIAPGPHVVDSAGQRHKVMVLPGEITTLSLANVKGVVVPMPQADPAASPVVAPVVPLAGQPSTGDDDAHEGASRAEVAVTPIGAVIPRIESIPAVAAHEAAGPSLSHGFFLYGGATLAAIGAAGLATGAYLATQTSARAAGATSQAEVARRNQQATTAASRATLLFVIGGVAEAAGAALLVPAFWGGRTLNTSVAAGPVGMTRGIGLVVERSW